MLSIFDIVAYKQPITDRTPKVQPKQTGKILWLHPFYRHLRDSKACGLGEGTVVSSTLSTSVGKNGEVIAFHTNPLLPLTLTETLRLWRETTLCCVLTRPELCSRRPRRCKHGDLPPTLIGRDPGGRGKQRDVLFVRDEFMTESEQRLCGGTVS